MNPKKIFIITLVFNFLLPSLLFCASQEKVYSLSELTNKSDFIVHGKVVSIKCYMDSYGAIMSDIKIIVYEDMRMKLNSNDEINFTLMGGTLGNIRSICSHTPIFKVDQEIIIFLQKRLDNLKLPNAFHITGFEQGKFNVVNDENNSRKILRDESMSPQLSINTSRGAKLFNNKVPLPYLDFISALESLILSDGGN